MPDISTPMGFAQGIGLGMGLLLFIWLRSRRYGTDVVKSFLPLWLAVCIGLGIASVVEVGLGSATVATRLPIIAALPALAALILRRLAPRGQP